MTKHLLATVAATTLALVSTTASAADFSFTGNFATDDGTAAFSFALASTTTVTLQSLGYAGGTNAAGQTIAKGGFDGVLSLYDAAGLNIGYGDDGTTIDPATGAASDPILALSLAAGRYTVYLSQYDNFGPASLALPFNFAGQPTFRGGFVDFYGSQRTGNWALDIKGVSVAGAIPEASTWALMLVGFGAVGAALRRRRRLSVSFG